MTQPAFYKDSRLGKYDTVIYPRPDGEILIGRIEKLSKVTRKRPDDGADLDQSGDPQYYYVYPKFLPDESTLKIRPPDLKICDRYLTLGSLVKEFETGRVGFVQGIKQQITVRLLEHNLVLRDLEFKYLTDPWKLDIQFRRPVYYDGWIGRISCPIERKVFLTYVDKINFRAFAFTIPWNQLAHILVECGFVKLATFSFESSGFAFWPGRRFQVPRDLLANKKYNITWLNGLVPTFGYVNPQESEVTLRVDRTEVNPFTVQWLRQVPGYKTPKPKTHFRDEEISSISVIRPNQLSSLGDVRMYRLRQQDHSQLITEDLWKLVLRRRHWLPRSKSTPPPDVLMANNNNILATKSLALQIHENVAVEVIYTRSTAEVAWTDGTISRIDSCKICRIHSELLEVGTIIDPCSAHPKTLEGKSDKISYGVIQLVKNFETNHGDAEQMAVVKWFGEAQGSDDNEDLHDDLDDIPLGEAELPLKNIHRHPRYNFKSPNSHNMIVYRANESADFTVGYIINSYPDGQIRVRCLDQIIRRYWPHQIVPLMRHNVTAKYDRINAKEIEVSNYQAASTHQLL